MHDGPVALALHLQRLKSIRESRREFRLGRENYGGVQRL